MPAFRKINATISAANKSKKLGNWEKLGKNQLKRMAVSNIKWFDFWIKKKSKMMQ